MSGEPWGHKYVIQIYVEGQDREESWKWVQAGIENMVLPPKQDGMSIRLEEVPDRPDAQIAT